MKTNDDQKAPGGNPGTPVCWAIPDLHGMWDGIPTRSPPASAGGFLLLAQAMPHRSEAACYFITDTPPCTVHALPQGHAGLGERAGRRASNTFRWVIARDQARKFDPSWKSAAFVVTVRNTSCSTSSARPPLGVSVPAPAGPRSLGMICSACSFFRLVLVISLGLHHPQILSLEVVPFHGCRSQAKDYRCPAGLGSEFFTGLA